MLFIIGLLFAAFLLTTLVALLFPIGMMLLIPAGLALIAGLFVFWIWMLVEAIQNKGLTDNERIVWVLVIVFLHWLGALVYLLAGHPKRRTLLVNPT